MEYEPTNVILKSNISNIVENLLVECESLNYYINIKNFIKYNYTHLQEVYKSSDANNSLIKQQYRLLLKLNNFVEFKEFYEANSYVICCLMVYYNPYNGKGDWNEIYNIHHNNIQIPNLSPTLQDYIYNNVVPNIAKCRKNNNNGVWGKNAVTGQSITYEQLGDIDSQRW